MNSRKTQGSSGLREVSPVTVQSRWLTDADWNELVDILKSRLNRTGIIFRKPMDRKNEIEANEPFGSFRVLLAGGSERENMIAAEVISNQTGLPLYRIDPSKFVNRYIGETEKNLNALFDKAERQECILFFDEADALFGKRTEVKETRNRNMESGISRLLDRLKSLEGPIILSVNSHQNLPEKLMHRLEYVVDFPSP